MAKHGFHAIDKGVSRQKYERLKQKLQETEELNRMLSRYLIENNKNNTSRLRKRPFTNLSNKRYLVREKVEESSNGSGSDGDKSDSESEDTSHPVKRKKAIVVIEPPPLPPKPILKKPPPRLTTPVETSKEASSSSSTVNQLQKPQQQQQIIRKNPVGRPPAQQSSKAAAVAPTRKVQPIKRDINGNPQVPQQIGVTKVISLGKIKLHPDTFHTKQYIFPVGYQVESIYDSMINPKSKTLYTLSVLDGGDEPIFQVLAHDQPNQVISATKCNTVWLKVLANVNAIRENNNEDGTAPARGNYTNGGPAGCHYFGFQIATIAQMIQELPGADQLENYQWQKFEEVSPKLAQQFLKASRTRLKSKMKEILEQ